MKKVIVTNKKGVLLDVCIGAGVKRYEVGQEAKENMDTWLTSTFRTTASTQKGHKRNNNKVY